MEVFNLFHGELETPADLNDPDGYACRGVRVGPKIGASRVGMSVYELPQGQAICPYHFEWTDEEWLIVLAGRPTLRSPEGEWSSLATVVRRTALPAADEHFRMWLLGLRVDLETDLVRLRHILSVEPAL